MKARKLPRGVFERDGLLWVRYADGQGKIRREKVGPFLKQAEAVYQKRKSEVREGKFFPDKINHRMILFAEIGRDFLAHSKQTKRSHGHDASRMQTLLRLWRDCGSADLTPGRIERDLGDCADHEGWMP